MITKLRRLHRHQLVTRALTAAALAGAMSGIGLIPAGQFSSVNAQTVSAPAVRTAGSSSCQLGYSGGAIQHVIYIQFDNLHLSRDLPNVPSDLEQIPSLLNFVLGNGTMFSKNHTPLISHTADDILTSITGLYGSRHGMPVSNSYDYFDASGVPHFTSSFKYWTDLTGDNTYNLLTAPNTNTPAPWVSYTRAGCDFGAIATANTVVENSRDPNVGIAVHCAQTSALCSTTNGGVPDVLPSEPGGYNGFNALFGHTNVDNATKGVNGTGITDVYGNHISAFPGFDGMSAANSLGYIASMQEAGVPVTYAYISDAHDNHAGGNAFGPGQSGYVLQLKAYDLAFSKFFQRLQADGITKANTLFVFTADEGDHFVGAAPTSPCNGVNVPCTYAPGKIGEIDANMNGLLSNAGVDPTVNKYDIHFDDAPTFYLNGQPGPFAGETRQFEHAVAGMTTTNLIRGTTDHLAQYLADPIEENLLHMVTADPNRTPTFTMFGNPDYYFQTFPQTTGCTATSSDGNFCVNPAFAWNHGDVQPDITTTWLGMVGPGVRHEGLNFSTWLDHTDIRPTMMALLNLKDDYQHDGRVLLEDIYGGALHGTAQQQFLMILLGRLYKQLNAPVGQFGLDSLTYDTKIIEGDDVTYQQQAAELQTLGQARDTLASAIQNVLDPGPSQAQVKTSNLNTLLAQATVLLQRMHKLATNS